jgi:hypothetical protein
MNDEKRQGPDLSPGPDQHHDLQGPAEDQDDPTRNPAVAQADLTDEHLAKLEAVGVKAEVAKAHAYSITDVGQLPDEFEFYGERAVPSIAFVWRSPSGQESTQLRPDTPVTVKGQERKYLFAKGAGSAVGVVRHESESEVVHFVEGMKQALAVCSWLPEGEGSIYAVAGCRNWSRDGVPVNDLAMVDGRRVRVWFDADIGNNPNVFEAGVRFQGALELEGATEVLFVRLEGVGKTAGVDDVLGEKPEERRTAYLHRLLDRVKPLGGRGGIPRPQGKVKTEPRAIEVPEVFEDGDGWKRPVVKVDEDRRDVVGDILKALVDAWDGVCLFDFGKVISKLEDGKMEPLDRDMFAATVIKAVYPVRVTPFGEVVPVWPEGQTMGAVMTYASSFKGLDKLASAPFVRKDGTVCLEPGYDEASRTFLIEDQDLGKVKVPDQPSAEQIEAAVWLLRDEWLGDFPFATKADKANALALVLTPFIRGQVELVPLAVVDGLQMGVGKNLLADCLAILVTGRPANPLPFSMDDEENRKLVTSQYRTGEELFIFDEAHRIEGAALARSITAINYRDRILGVSQMAEFPNRITWVALGNQVNVIGDLARRVYRIALHPDEPDPQNRLASSFRHPDLKAWTREHRAELLGAALTLIRAWFVAGQPYDPRASTMGSFENWERVVGGVLQVAGVDGFLGGLDTWREESDFVRSFWVAHLHWLHETFGGDEFLVADVRERAYNNLKDAELPPGMEDPAGKDYTRELGKAYARVVGKWTGGFRLVREGKGHNNAIKWKVERHEPGKRPSSGGNGGNTPPTHEEKNIHMSADDSTFALRGC